MPDIKEKPSMGKPRARSKSALLPQQAGRVLKEKYLRQFDQRPEGEEDGTGYATGEVEHSACRAVDELTAAPRNAPKERKAQATSTETPPASEAGVHGSSTAPATERPRHANTPKERPTVRQRSAAANQKDHQAPAPRATAKQPKERTTTHSAALDTGQPQAFNHSAKAGQAPSHSTLNNRRRGAAALHQSPPSTGPRSAQSIPAIAEHPASIQERPAAKERAKANIKTRANRIADAKSLPQHPAPKLRPATAQTAAKQTVRKTRQAAQQHMTRQMLTQAKQAAKTAATLLKRAAVAIYKAAAALVGSLVGLLGGGFLLIALVVVVIIAAVASSPFGLFFAAEPNAPDTVSVAQAVTTVNMAYNAKLEALQAGSYDSIVIHGQAPDWPDVLAVFAVKTAGADTEGMDVATLDTDRVEKLTAVFWDMTAITTRVEEIYHPGDGEDDPGWTEYILHITITAKTADEMRTQYRFTDYQNSALDELLSDCAALSQLAGSLTITDADLADILKNLPADLDPERREAVRVALTLVGKVNYFWGGKSSAIGWDSRWGTLQKVWAEGSSTTGTYRPYGLDCSGYTDWIFNNSMGYIIGHGGGVIMQHSYCTDISPAEAQPGDLAFFPDDSHVGIVVGRSEGGILVAHCSSGQNNVVVTEFAATGFTALGRPDVFD